MPFTDATWSTPEGNLTPEQFCQCCLVDMNPPGQEKVKAMCKLPVRSTPGGPYNRNALRNAGSRIFQMTGVSADEKRKAARRLVRLMGEAGIEVGETLTRLAKG